MPINIPRQLPARELLKKEKIFVMDEERAIKQDIRPLSILIVNLMPEKERDRVAVIAIIRKYAITSEYNIFEHGDA